MDTECGNLNGSNTIAPLFHKYYVEGKGFWWGRKDALGSYGGNDYFGMLKEGRQYEPCGAIKLKVMESVYGDLWNVGWKKGQGKGNIIPALRGKRKGEGNEK